MDKEQTYLALQKFQRYVVRESRGNLKRMKKNSSGKLYNSIKGNVKVNKNSFELDFDMLPYGQFQDKGVSGVKKKYNTPFTYRDKMPPPSKLDKWIVRKGLAPRKDGKFSARSIEKAGFKKSIQYLIARSIYMNGIKPSLFFTKPFEKAYKQLSPELVKSFGLDVESLMDFTLPKLK